MFGILKKKKAAPAKPAAFIPLFQVYEAFTNEINNTYSAYPDANPAELRLFTMSATSFFVQAFGNLTTPEMQSLIGKFVEEGIAHMLFHMPKADYSRLHAAFAERFAIYADLLFEAFNAPTAQQKQDCHAELVAAMDLRIGVERELIDRHMASLTVHALLTGYAVDVRNAVAV